MEYFINSLWNGGAINTHEPIKLTLSTSDDTRYMVVNVNAPFFNDNNEPEVPAGKACPQLWDYEVVEIFFLGDDEKYLEVELCPHGQHLVLMLNGTRNMIKDQLELQFDAKKYGKHWSGTAKIPVDYFPPNVTRMNAYAIHGSDDARQYEALYPATTEFQHPDFHRLQFFKSFDMKTLFPELVANYNPSNSHWN